MSKLRVHGFGMSIDGYGAGPSQSLENPLGVGGLALHEWAFKTRTFHVMMGKDGGETGVDDDFVARGFDDIGAWIIGRNMFGPVRGPWPDDTWKGWWGEDPPYHTPVFVLTNHARSSLTMVAGPRSTLSPMVSIVRLDALVRRLKEKITGWAAGLPRSEITLELDSSMKCT
jgi:dihydrofolate reductase